MHAMKNAFRYEVSTTYILRSRSKCSSVIDHYRNVVIADSPEQAEEMVLKREAHPRVAKLIIGGIVNLDVAGR